MFLRYIYYPLLQFLALGGYTIPDWITHLGIAYLVARIFKLNDYRLFLLGSILPDTIWIGVILAQRVLHSSLVDSYVYFFPYHTPIFLIFIAATIALLLRDFKESFLLVYSGSILHLILDLFQKGDSIVILFPLDFKIYSLGLFWADSLFGYFLLFISLVVLLNALVRGPTYPKINFVFRKKGIVLFLCIILFPLLTKSLIINEFYYSKFSMHPDEWDGKKIKLDYRMIYSENPSTFEVMGNYFIIDSNIDLRKRDMISFEGVYADGKIQTIAIHKHNPLLKPLSSVVGILLFLLILIKKRQR